MPYRRPLGCRQAFGIKNKIAKTQANQFLHLFLTTNLAVAAVLIPLQVHRARKEERALAAASGEKYQIYKRSTWF